MGIFLRNSNWGLRYGGAASPAGITRVAVLRTEFWGYSLKRERRTTTWRQGGKYGTLWPPRISWAAALLVKVSSSRGPVMVFQWSRSGGNLHAKLGKRLCLVSLSILQDQGWAQKELIITITPTQGTFEFVVYSPIHA